MRVSKSCNLEKQEVEIAEFKRLNPDKWSVLPQGYSAVQYKGYSVVASKIMYLLDTKGCANRKQVNCSTAIWLSAVAEVRRKLKRRRLVNWKEGGIVIGVKVERNVRK